MEPFSFARVVKLGHSDLPLIRTMLELIAIGGPSAGTRFPVGASAIEIGRAPSSSIVLDDSEAAWKHCVITSEPGERIRLVDLNTGAGTYVNGMRVREHVL